MEGSPLCVDWLSTVSFRFIHINLLLNILSFFLLHSIPLHGYIMIAYLFSCWCTVISSFWMQIAWLVRCTGALSWDDFYNEQPNYLSIFHNFESPPLFSLRHNGPFILNLRTLCFCHQVPLSLTQNFLFLQVSYPSTICVFWFNLNYVSSENPISLNRP